MKHPESQICHMATIPAPGLFQLKTHLLLIGHRTAGKTTLGELLAQRLGVPFVDIDRVIESRTGKPAAGLARESTAQFRAMELDVLSEFCASHTPAVIACGAGMQSYPAGVHIVEIEREGWGATARELRGPLRADLSSDEEIAWMRAIREPLFRAVAHARVHVARGTSTDTALDDLTRVTGFLVKAADSALMRISWFVPRTSGSLIRAEADARLFGGAGVEIRSDFFEAAQCDVPMLASLRTPDNEFFARNHHAAEFDCDIRLLDYWHPGGLAPRPFVISMHTDRFDTAGLHLLAGALRDFMGRYGAWAPFCRWKYAPTIKSWNDMRVCLDAVHRFRLEHGRGTFLPQGREWHWFRALQPALGNDHNYLHQPDVTDIDESALPPSLSGLLPHFTQHAPGPFHGLIGLPVEHSIGDMYHRSLPEAHGEMPPAYVKIPVQTPDIAKALKLLTSLGFGGLSVTAPLKRGVADCRCVSNPDGLESGNTLTFADGKWTLSDTDEAGMNAALCDVEAAGIAPGPAIVFGRGGVGPAVLRALEKRGWGPVIQVSARDGWQSGLDPVRLIVNAAGPAGDGCSGAPHTDAWLDLHYNDSRQPPDGATLYRNGRTFFAAQAAAQRELWRSNEAADIASVSSLMQDVAPRRHDRAAYLLKLLLAEFPLRRFDVNIPPKTFSITTAEDIEELINRITDEEFRKDERLPYWAELWHSASALAGFILDDESLVRGYELVEIGCGLGVPGIAAAAAGALVTFTDNDSHALHAAEFNCLANLPGTNADFRLLDFRDPPYRKWERIIAADVLYENRYLEPFAEFLAGSLAPGGAALIAEPNRHIAEPFFQMLRKMNFVTVTTQKPAVLHGRTVEVAIHVVRAGNG
jgi:shikimate kinase/shikimate 5-dehydrogenase/predicted nicotinamide N-methyase